MFLKNLFIQIIFHIFVKTKEMSNISEKEYTSNMVVIKWFRGGLLALVMLIGLMMWGCPSYNVWASEMSGKAEMAKAEQNRMIQVEEAKANLESQKLNSKSEVERAKGMAEAIGIEDGKLTEQYIHYLWVRNIDKMDGDKIYIPTEANMPILEARRDSN